MKAHSFGFLVAGLLIAIVGLSSGCGSGSDAKADVTAELESEIKAHDTEVEEAEKAQSAPTKNK